MSKKKESWEEKFHAFPDSGTEKEFEDLLKKMAENVYGYNWKHSLSDIFNALIGAGLQIESFNEFPFTLRERISGMVQGEDDLWRLTKQNGMVPFLFSLQARKVN